MQVLRQLVNDWTRKHRVLLFTVACVLFVAGIIWSAQSINFDSQNIIWEFIAAATVINAVSMLFNASELRLCASACSGSMSFRKALAYSSSATIANILPLPGSILVRGAALRDSGASWQKASAIILAAGLLWLTMAFAVSSIALLSGWLGLMLAALFSIASLVIVIWIASISNAAVASGFLAVRGAMLGMMIWRLWLIFAALGAAVSVIDVSIYSVVGIIGNAAAIVPAGLGLTEAVGSAMAKFAGQDPAIAFLALALHRLIGIALAGIVTLTIWRPGHFEIKAEGA